MVKFDFLELVAPFIKGLFESIYSIIAEDIIGFLINLISFDFEPTSLFFFKMLGISASSLGEALRNPLFDIFIIIAVILTFSIFVYHMIVIGLGNLVEQKQTLYTLIIRLFLFAIPGILIARNLLCFISDTVQDILSELTIDNYVHQLNAFSLEGQLVDGWRYLTLIIIIFLDVVILVEFIKLLLEVIEKYLVVMFMNITSPIAFGFLVSKTTSDITRKFFSMYLSQQFLLIMNRFFLIAFCRIIVTVDMIEKITTLLAIIAYLKFAQHFDNHMKSMGLSVAQTGGSLLDSCMAAGKALSTMAGLARSGANIAGTAMQKAGAVSGNYKLSSVGSLVKGFSQKGMGLDNTPETSLKDYARMGGVANTKGTDAKLQKDILSSIKAGQYETVAKLNGDMKTEAIKNLLGEKDSAGKDIMQKAFGYNASTIKSANIDKYGNISGTMQYENQGKKYTKDFTLSMEGKGKPAVSCDFDHNIRYANIATTNTIQDGSKIDYEYNGGFSTLSTTTGKTFDDDRISSLGTQTIESLSGIYTGYTGDGRVTFRHDTSTGTTLYNPIENAYWENDSNFESFKKEFYEGGSFYNNPQLSEYIEPINIIKDPAYEGKDGVRIIAEYGKSTTYPDGHRLTFESATATNFEGKGNVMDLGKKSGSLYVRKHKKN